MSEYHFAEYTFNSKNGSLCKAGKITNLRAKNAQLLLFLLTSDNQLCSKEELYSEVWGDIIVQDSSLSKSINELRVILGDSAKKPNFIKTWPKKGYQFLASVNHVEKIHLETKSKNTNQFIWLFTTIAIVASLFFSRGYFLTQSTVNDTSAKDFYLLGLDYQSRSEDKSYYFKALKQYQHAVEVNSEYASAWAQLSIIQSIIYSKAFDKSNERAKASWQAAIKSLELKPDLALGHYALASWYYLIPRDHQTALQLIEKAEYDPVLTIHIQLFRAAILRRQGDFDQSLIIMESAFRDNPRTSSLADSLAITYLMIGQYNNAIDSLDKARLFALERSQDTARLDYRSALIFYFKGDNLVSLLEAVNKIKLPENQPHILLFNIFEPTYQAILTSKAVSPEHIFENQNQVYPLSLLQAIDLHLTDSQSENKKLLLTKAERQLLKMNISDDPRVMMSLATVYALTKRTKAAYKLAQAALDIYPPHKDAIGRMYLEIELLQIHMLTGNKIAFENLKSIVMEKPSLLSHNWLKHDPVWQHRENNKVSIQK
jgi:DNA-binding winged helix-turn-helix (wHTH) protein/Flp pilus assembly protein TadD